LQKPELIAKIIARLVARPIAMHTARLIDGELLKMDAKLVETSLLVGVFAYANR